MYIQTTQEVYLVVIVAVQKLIEIYAIILLQVWFECAYWRPHFGGVFERFDSLIGENKIFEKTHS